MVLSLAGLPADAEPATNAPATEQRPAAWAVPLNKPGLPNAFKVSATLYRGAQPTAEGFAELKRMGVRTVINLRAFHADPSAAGTNAPADERIRVQTWHPEREEVVRFLAAATDTNRTPVFVHCQHGADRTGMMCAIYRVAVCGWSKEDAIAEMTRGGFGFHTVWANLVEFIERLDVETIKKQAGFTTVTRRDGT